MSAGPYHEKFQKGANVRVVERAKLERFAQEWKFHHPLHPNQLSYAGHTGTVESVAFYHGGDALYKLNAVPGLWHEQCLESPS